MTLYKDTQKNSINKPNYVNDTEIYGRKMRLDEDTQMMMEIDGATQIINHHGCKVMNMVDSCDIKK